MIWPWRKCTPDEDEERDRPDLEGARRRLEAIRAQWPDVHRWTEAARAEKVRNNFGRNAEVVMRTRGRKA